MGWDGGFESGSLQRRVVRTPVPTETGSDPRAVYHDVLIALDEARGINNGQPSLWASLFDELDITAGDDVVHLGCGTGYYTAIAHLARSIACC
jgi:protein-L-isoaspartate O-methyltransferase